MRQFLLGKNTAYATGANYLEVADGAIGFFYNKNGVPTVTTTGNEIKGEAMLVLGRTEDKGGPVTIPIYKNNFSYVKGEYSAATTFKATVKLVAPTSIGDYSIIIAKKGIKFNERNKWTAMVYVKDTSMTAATLATKLKDAINANVGHECTASVSGDTITITAKTAGVDYSVLGADNLFGQEVTITAIGSIGYGSVDYVQDLADKAAADAGFEYTYRDAYYYLYLNYPLNPLKQNDSEDTGFTIFTIRFAEPRKVKTRDEVVNQIVQVAFPTGTAAITTFESVCKVLSGEQAAAQASEQVAEP